MEPKWAEENLQTIRTLMERSAVYRRALAPIMTFAGIIGLLAAIIGWFLKISTMTAFVIYWYVIAVIVLAGAFLLARRQAWQAAETFWSPPTRRITEAIFLPLLAGFVCGILLLVVDHSPSKWELPTGDWLPNPLTFVLLPLLWIIFYGCAIYSAGFFISRGMRIFGLIMVILGCIGFAFAGKISDENLPNFAIIAMGFAFGVLHLLCGIYLSLTEKKTSVM